MRGGVRFLNGVRRFSRGPRVRLFDEGGQGDTDTRTLTPQVHYDSIAGFNFNTSTPAPTLAPTPRDLYARPQVGHLLFVPLPHPLHLLLRLLLLVLELGLQNTKCGVRVRD